MDTLHEIADLLAVLTDEIQTRFRSGVSRHIERSEYHFKQAKLKKDDQYYTDAIYRTNQAFEGILREAFEILTGQIASGKRPFDLEKYFEQNNVFNTRVKNAFTNYRQEWRNPSTHNHNLFFGRDEAFLAIMNVSAFIFILLNQIVEKIAYTTTKEELLSHGHVPAPEVMDSETFVGRLVNALIGFRQAIRSTRQLIQNEAQLMGAIGAYLEQRIEGIKTKQELADRNSNLRVDFYIMSPNNEIVLLEIKNGFDKKRQTDAVARMTSYLQESGLPSGIIYYYVDDEQSSYGYEKLNVGTYALYSVFPKKKARRGKLVSE